MSKKRSYSKVAIDMFSSADDIKNNFSMVWGYKTFVEDTYKGQATFRLEFVNNDFKTSYIDYKFPKGWTKKSMLRNALGNLGFNTLLNDFGEVVLLDRKY